MTRQPLAWDLFCGAGGAGYGLSRAGFDVVGFDLAPQPRYPLRFLQADAFEAALALEPGMRGPHLPDFVWASPPCQGRTAYKRRPSHVRPVPTDRHIQRIRDALSLSRESPT